MSIVDFLESSVSKAAVVTAMAIGFGGAANAQLNLPRDTAFYNPQFNPSGMVEYRVDKEHGSAIGLSNANYIPGTVGFAFDKRTDDYTRFKITGESNLKDKFMVSANIPLYGNRFGGPEQNSPLRLGWQWNAGGFWQNGIENLGELGLMTGFEAQASATIAKQFEVGVGYHFNVLAAPGTEDTGAMTLRANTRASVNLTWLIAKRK